MRTFAALLDGREVLVELLDRVPAAPCLLVKSRPNDPWESWGLPTVMTEVTDAEGSVYAEVDARRPAAGGEGPFDPMWLAHLAEGVGAVADEFLAAGQTNGGGVMLAMLHDSLLDLAAKTVEWAELTRALLLERDTAATTAPAADGPAPVEPPC